LRYQLRAMSKFNFKIQPVFEWCSCCSIFSFMCSILATIVCLFVLFLLEIVFSVLLSIYGLWLPLWYLRFMAYDYHFGIFCLNFLFISCYMIGSNMFLFIRKSTCFNGIYVIQAFYLYVLSLLFSYLVSLVYEFYQFHLTYFSAKEKK
jgi:hypothetical protein